MRVLKAMSAALALAAVAAAPAGACAVCYGGADSQMTTGMNNAILTLLGVVAVVQGGFVALFLSIRRRSRRLQERRARFELIDGGAR
ncbi:MAG: hypothetical protein R3325_07880 [Thermoanaerobaculia bacterium]|nr:hypothetical protein [Thermoanaerobaculia bacterium]